MKKLGFFLVLVLFTGILRAQNSGVHSHNDYLRQFPFWEACAAGCTSIEADIILKNDTLYVAHSVSEIKGSHTFKKLYLDPLIQVMGNDRTCSLENRKTLQLLVDIKTESLPTLMKLCEELSDYSYYFNPAVNERAMKIVISGNRPPAGEINRFPGYIFYDLTSPEQAKSYGPQAALISRNLKDFTKWNGLGRPVEEEFLKLEAFISSCHKAGYPVRFWNAPDTKTAYTWFYNHGVDFINTDMPSQTSEFVKGLSHSFYSGKEYGEPYMPKFNAGNDTAALKNIILFIGDGMGFSQLMAGYIGNRGRLTCTSFIHTGFLSTWAADNLGTDSAAGGTALATGKKTRNRYIGVDTLGRSVSNIMEVVGGKGMLTGIVTSDRITGATPASFYAHQTERDSSEAIYSDLLNSDINFIAGYNPVVKNQSTGKFKLAANLDEINRKSKEPVMYYLNQTVSENSSGGSMLSDLTGKSIDYLANDNGFFLMVECSGIDGGGHSNDITTVVNEVLQLDKAVAIAAQYADSHPGTLVLVTADHETGGMVIPGGNIPGAVVEGHFYSNDHTANWVPVMAYGAGASAFTGMYENTEIYNKIRKLLRNEGY